MTGTQAKAAQILILPRSGTVYKECRDIYCRLFIQIIIVFAVSKFTFLVL